MALYHSAKGSVNYTIVGSPTIVDGVASGFSGSDLLRTTKNPLSCPNEGKIAFHYTRQSSMNQILIVCISGSYFPFRIRLIDRTIQFSWMTDSATQATNLDGTYNITEGDYYITFNFSNSIWTVKLYNSANELLETLTSDQTSVYWPSNISVLNIGSYSATSYWQGSIYLNNTYIKVNGQPWFGVCPVEVKKHQLRGPVGYTVVGSPTIVDGVVSGFSSSGYVQLTDGNHPTIAGAKYELFIKFTTPATVARNGICGSSYSYAQGGVWIDGAKKLVSNVTTNVATRNFYFSSSALTGSTTYYAHLILDSINNDYRALLSTDKTNWTTTYLTLGEGETISPQPLTSVFRFGYNWDSSGGKFDGSIDLNETYIKVNGKLWFYQPAPTKYIIKDNSLVFADQGLYLTGPVNYTVVGSPTIVDGVVTYARSANCLSFPSNFELVGNEVEIVAKITGKEITIFDGYSSGTPVFSLKGTSGGFFYLYLNKAPVYGINISGNSYLRFHKTADSSVTTLQVGPDGVNWATPETRENLQYTNFDSNKFCLYAYDDNNIDLKGTYIKVNGSLWGYGKNYATKNIAPVPAGYTYGATTTPAIGWVDMRTQAFTAAPSGATIGRDE